MMNRIGVPVGAGVASALLFVATLKGTAIAMSLAYLAPLPIMIATLGWGPLGGAIAGAVAGASVLGVVDPLSSLQFGLIVALPGWLLPAFAVLPAARLPWRKGGSTAEWMPVGAIVTLAAIIGALISFFALVMLVVFHGGYENGLQALVDALQPLIEDATDGGALLPDGETARDFALAIVRFSPAAISGCMLLMLCINLYAAARSAALSHLLRRPWPDIPTSLSLPAPMAALAIASLGPAFALPAPADQFAWIVAGALGAAFVLQGLATLHALSRGLPMRPLLLAALYFCCLARSNWTLPAIAIIGVVESFASLRARAAAHKSKI